MPQSMSFKELDQYLGDSMRQVQAAVDELDEIQTKFVSAYEESKRVHDETLGSLTSQAAVELDVLPAPLRDAVGERLLVEREALETRRKELHSNLVPEANIIADDLLASSQQATNELRQLNPRLDQEEEQLKTDRAAMQVALDELNESIRQRSGCLRSLFNFPRLIDMDRRRQQLIGRMQENAKSLKRVRDQWSAARQQFAADEERYREQWRRANLDAARFREELAQLDDDDKREQLALQRAIFHTVDNWKEVLHNSSSPLEDEVNQMVAYNIRTDDYQAGLGKIAGLIALLNGIKQGLENIGQSVRALDDEQHMHSAYLRPVDVRVDDAVLSFHRRWEGFRQKVLDEETLGENPEEFIALFDEEIEGWLSEHNIKRMFDELGNGLTMATAEWK